MSMDIRSYFTVTSKSNTKLGNATPTPSKLGKKRATKFIDSSDEDIIPETPSATTKKKVEKTFKARKINVIVSDSEEEDDERNRTKKDKRPKQDVLKPISTLEAFGNKPVIQSKIPDKPKLVEKPVVLEETSKSKRGKKKRELRTEIGIHNDKAFEQTLLELDDDFFIENVEELDRTIEEALNKGRGSTHRETGESSKLEEGSKGLKRKTTTKRSSEDLKRRKASESPSKTGENGEQSEKVAVKEDTPNTKASDIAPASKKRPIEDDSEGDPDQERFEKKRHSAVLYQKYLNRSGPAHHGSKEIPKGKPDCLHNLCFLRTGVLDSLESNEFEDVIKSHGGRVVHAVSKKVNYVIAGEDPGPAKLEKAKNYGIPVISEDELLDLIKKKSGLTAAEAVQVSDVNNEREKLVKKSTPPSTTMEKAKTKSKAQTIELQPKVTNSQATNILAKSLAKSVVEPELRTGVTEQNLPWTEKYRPMNIKSIIGQQGDKSNLKRFLNWLQNWHKNHSGKNRPKLSKPSPWASNDDGSYFKAALLSGPPGVGKTTTANLVAKELGFDVVEFNASDTRSKKLLHEEVSQLLSTKSLAGFFSDGSAPTSKHVLLMDEVDGMAGNEDRGGVQELISLIKSSSVPIICMCNDRNHPKIRSLANYCVDLRFSRPRIEQIKGAMMSVCFKEGVKISPEALAEIINGAGMDVRQTLTNLSMWSAGQKTLSTETASKEAKNAQKDTPLGPWEVCRKVFSAEDHKTMSLVDRARLFYHDYSLAPLFVQENYLKVMPHCAKEEHLARFALAADAMSMGDMIDTKIRRTNNWSLLDVEAMCASVLPGYYVEGHMNGQIDFPGWLGKNSKKNKFKRFVSELQAHMRTSISGSRTAVNLDYITHLRNNIVRPLAKNGAAGVEGALEVMHAYNLLRDDLDSITELALWPKQKDPMNMVDSKVKAAFTRAYNKQGVKLPYAVQTAAVKKTTSATEIEAYGEDEEAIETDQEDEEDVAKDAMIKAKTASKGIKKEAKSTAGASKRPGGKTSEKPSNKKSRK